MIPTAKTSYRVINILTIARLAVILGLLISCSTKNQELTVMPKSDEISQMNQQLFASARMSTAPSDYLLGPGDLLQIKVFEAEELNTTDRVSSRGYVTLPLLDAVLVKGLSAREAEEKIEDLYRVRYIKDPHISIFVEEHFSQRITLVGQFKNPGTYDYPSKQRLLDVMALGGGLSEKAGQNVQIRRSSSSPGEHAAFTVDLDQLINKGKAELNIEINGGDVIFVPEAGMFFVDGAVRRPGAYYIKHKTTIQEAFLEAGGLSPYANKQHATLIRYMETGERQTVELDLTHSEVMELEVKDRDVLITSASTYGKLVHGLGINIGVPGFGGIGYRNPEN